MEKDAVSAEGGMVERDLGVYSVQRFSIQPTD